MNELIEIAAKTERKLTEQTSEFNILRDRILILSAYGIALITAVLSFWGNLNEIPAMIIAGAGVISLISISIILFAAYSNPISRGMETSLIAELVENEENTSEDFFLHEIAYNLKSFEENIPMLKKIQWKLNFGLIVQTIVTAIIGASVYFNNI